MWIPDLDLFESDKEILEGSDWLNDNIVYVAMKLLKQQTKNIAGWQHTQHGKSLTFEPIRKGDQFIQILYLESHWVTVSNVKCTDPNAVRIYDSRGSDPSLHLKKQICSFLRPKQKQLVIDVANVQRQHNGVDCGVFAIAYATELAHGQDPVRCQWATHDRSMRKHLLKCLEDKKVTPFPLEKERRTTLSSRVRTSIIEDIHCSCRMPNDKSMAMVRCDFCKYWYHKECEGIDLDFDLTSKWKCSECIRFVQDNNY